jgi:lipopolysaccharide/colanic/teichoic acid biosynthesis glycosyltransferase
MNIHQSYALTSRIDTNRFLRRWTSLSRTTFFCAVLLSDVLVIVGMSWLSGAGYHLAAYGVVGDTLSFLEVGALAAIVFVIPNLFRGEYRLANFFNFKQHLRRSAQLWNVTFICLLALGFLAQVSAVFSRGAMIAFYVSTICVLLATRYLRTFGVSVVGCHFLTPLEAQASPQARRRALAADLEAAITSARILEPDAIFLVMPWSDTDPIDQCAEALLKLPAEIHLAAEHILDRFEHVQLSKFGPVASLQLTRLPLSRLERIEKRMFDLLFASAALILLTPVLLVAAILIKLDSPGPIFFLQHRFGFNQKPFRILKLRTMHTLDDGPVITQAKRNDPRITKVGAWLRRWNIDELPQLFNVIMGDMSLVGPRPHALSHDREYEQRIAVYARRHNVKPGITGWAQIHGFRGETDTDEKMTKRVEYDLYYIDNWWLGLDLQIMLRTALSRSSYRNAV